MGYIRSGPAGRTAVAVALIIGTIELIGVLAEQADITTGPLAAIGDIPLDYGIVLLFLATWLVARSRCGASATSSSTGRRAWRHRPAPPLRRMALMFSMPSAHRFHAAAMTAGDGEGVKERRRP